MGAIAHDDSQVVSAGRTRPAGALDGDPRGQVKYFKLGQLAFGIRAREEQKHLDHLGEVSRLVVHQREDATVLLGRPLAAERHVDLPKDRGQGGAELVRRVAGEAALALERLLEPGEQPVEGLAKVLKFIAGRR